MKPHLYLAIPVFSLLAASSPAADWPQLQNGPQRLGYSAEKVDVPTVQDAWVKGFGKDKINNQVQPIVVAGRVYIGTETGLLLCLDATTGSQLWRYPATGSVGPILHTVGSEGGKVFFGSLDGNVYAVDAVTGAEMWRFTSGRDTGFTSAVLLAEGKVFIADREGIYYCLDENTGQVVWQVSLGVPILMSSAYNNGRIFFGAQDLTVFALNSSNGAVLWRTPPVYGLTFKDYWPVAYKGLVFIRPKGFYNHGFLGYVPALSLIQGLLPQTELDKQASMIQQFQTDRTQQSMFVFDEATGQEIIMPSWSIVSLDTSMPPPCVDGDGRLIVPVMVNGWMGAWGRLDVDQRRVVELLWDGKSDWGGYPNGGGNPDETINVSAAGRLVLTMHTMEASAFYTGYYNVDRQQWTRINPLQAEQYWLTANEGEAGPASISNGAIFHVTGGNVNARTVTVLP